MSPSLMDIGDGANSPGSLSAEESNSNTAGSEREGEGHQVETTGMKRREKNRDAARKTRRKQTERADELHEELQHLEQSNSAFHKEIAALKKQLQYYTKVLALHEPNCCLRASASTSSPVTHPSVSSSAGPHISSSPHQASSSLSSPPSSVTSSISPSLNPERRDSVKNTHLSSSASFPLGATLSTELILAPSSSSSGLQRLVSTRVTTVGPVCTSHLSSPVTSSAHTSPAQPQPGQNFSQETSSMPADACFATLSVDMLDVFLTKQTSFPTAPSDMMPDYPHLAGDSGGLVAHGCPLNFPPFYSGHFSGTTNNSGALYTPLPLTLPAPAPHSPTVAPQTNLDQSPAPPFNVRPEHRRQVTPNPSSLLSLLTNPSPLIISTSSSDGPISQPPPIPLLADSFSDPSLSQLLEVDDWILSGTTDQ